MSKPPNPCQVLPFPDDQAFKYMSLWGPFLFKPPQGAMKLAQPPVVCALFFAHQWALRLTVTLRSFHT